MDDNQYFKYLLDNYLKNSLTIGERAIFFELICSGEYDSLISDDILDKLNHETSIQNLDLTKQESSKIIQNIIQSSASEIKLSAKYARKALIYVSSIAALLAIVGFLFLKKIEKGGSGKFLISDEIAENVIYKNTSDTIQYIMLSDGSTINLYPRSTLQSPQIFLDSNRIVRLTGSAFFQIAPDKTKPFIVFSEKLQTRVLGTSFLINSNSKEGIEEVEVRTGQVEVSTYNAKSSSKSNQITNLVLIPNQKGVYRDKTQVLNKTLVASPQPLISKNSTKNTEVTNDKFVYDQVLIPQIFKDLEIEYGVRIILLNNTLKNDVFTGSLSGSDLFNKLKIICLSTQSSYTVDGIDILIK